MEGINSSILFFIVIAVAGGMVFYKTILKGYGLKQFCLMFTGAIMGCVFVFALPWLIGMFFVVMK